MKASPADKIASELKRLQVYARRLLLACGSHSLTPWLQGMSGGSMKPELQAWMQRRINVLSKMSKEL